MVFNSEINLIKLSLSIKYIVYYIVINFTGINITCDQVNYREMLLFIIPHALPLNTHPPFSLIYLYFINLIPVFA